MPFKPERIFPGAYQWSLDMAASLCRHSRHTRNGQADFILPAAAPGSLGDVAMLLGLAQLLEKRNQGEARYFDYSVKCEWSKEVGGVSAGLIPRSIRRYLEFAFSVRRIGCLYINGADVLDGTYSLRDSLDRLRLARFVALAGRPVTITGFSLRSQLPSEIVRALQEMPHNVRLCARDPVSYRRLNSVIGRQAIAVADLAFLMQPAVSTQEEERLLEVLESRITAGHRLVGICLNLHSVRIAGAAPETRARWIVGVVSNAWHKIKSLFPESTAVVLPHDFRGEWNDVKLGAEFIQAAGLGKDDAILVECATAPAIKAFCAKLNVLITGRMHCGIAALGSGVPAVLFDYQGKVEGLLNQFGLDTSVSTRSDAGLCTERIVFHVRSLLESEQSVKARIAAKLPDVLALARANLGLPGH
jgi:polysaccharide pyruvyl transferase WcaK-like protein